MDQLAGKPIARDFRLLRAGRFAGCIVAFGHGVGFRSYAQIETRQRLQTDIKELRSRQARQLIELRSEAWRIRMVDKLGDSTLDATRPRTRSRRFER